VRRRRWVSGGTALALLVSPAIAADAEASWREARTAHFRILATWDEQELVEAAARLERFRSAILLDCCKGESRGIAPVTLIFLPRAQPVEEAWGLRSWGKLLPGPVVVTWGRPVRWLLRSSPLGPERAVLIARAILEDADGPAPRWKPWERRAYAASYGTLRDEAEGRVRAGETNTAALQAYLSGPYPTQSLLDRWDGTDRLIGVEADTLLEGMSYVRRETEGAAMGWVLDLPRVLGRIGQSTRVVPVPVGTVRTDVRPVPPGAVESILHTAGIR